MGWGWGRFQRNEHRVQMKEATATNTAPAATPPDFVSLAESDPVVAGTPHPLPCPLALPNSLRACAAMRCMCACLAAGCVSRFDATLSLGTEGVLYYSMVSMCAISVSSLGRMWGCSCREGAA